MEIDEQLQDLNKDWESIKVIKNTKGYNWEIRCTPKNMLDDAWLDRIEKLNNEMLRRFGSAQ